MCDNCKALNGEKRRSFSVGPGSSGPLQLQAKKNNGTKKGGSTISLVDDETPLPPVAPGSRFVKASTLRSISLIDDDSETVLPTPLTSGSKFVKASSLLPSSLNSEKFQPNPSSGFSSARSLLQSDKVIDLAETDEGQNNFEWLEPLQKRSKKR
jgi:hypothetical protein